MATLLNARGLPVVVRFNSKPYRPQALVHERQANTVLKGSTLMGALGGALVIGHRETGAQAQPGFVLGQSVRRDLRLFRSGSKPLGQPLICPVRLRPDRRADLDLVYPA